MSLDEKTQGRNVMKICLVMLLIYGCAIKTKYPAVWWQPVPEEGAPNWEILPQAAGKDEVILSKRHELGILSNFAATPFWYENKKYASVEGFWQMMKYPEGKDDPRSKFVYPHTREEVANMSGFEAKAAGDAAEAIMQKHNINWVTFNGKRMTYCSEKPGEHYRLIKEAMMKKLRYNEEVRRLLMATWNLKLKPDHHGEACKAPEWKYYELWMHIRNELKRSMWPARNVLRGL